MNKQHLIFSWVLFLAITILLSFYEYSWANSSTTNILWEQNNFNTINYSDKKEPAHSTESFTDNLLSMTGFVGSVALNKVPLKEREYDSDNDMSITKFVSRKISLQDKKYIPSDLVDISSPYLVWWKWMKLRSEAYEQLELMAQEFTDIFDKKLVIVSAYRSYSYQANLKKQWCSDTLCASPGHSEHQLGLAIDLFAATTANKFLSKKDFQQYYKRLAANAHRYGRHNTYQKWPAVDTYQIEPRHWRYLGRELATELFEQKVTFGEWVGGKSS